MGEMVTKWIGSDEEYPVYDIINPDKDYKECPSYYEELDLPEDLVNRYFAADKEWHQVQSIIGDLLEAKSDKEHQVFCEKHNIGKGDII